MCPLADPTALTSRRPAGCDHPSAATAVEAFENAVVGGDNPIVEVVLPVFAYASGVSRDIYAWAELNLRYKRGSSLRDWSSVMINSNRREPR